MDFFGVSFQADWQFFEAFFYILAFLDSPKYNVIYFLDNACMDLEELNETHFAILELQDG
jgi:hypothetical protein